MGPVRWKAWIAACVQIAWTSVDERGRAWKRVDERGDGVKDSSWAEVGGVRVGLSGVGGCAARVMRGEGRSMVCGMTGMTVGDRSMGAIPSDAITSDEITSDAITSDEIP